MTRIALVVAAITIVIDQITKTLVVSRLELGDPVGIFWKLQLNLFYNTGSAFSLGEGLGPYIGVLAVLVSGALLWWSRAITSRWSAVFIGMIVGGALGNVLDRIFRGGGRAGDADAGFLGGAVVDFIDLQFWPVFNVADSAIVVGAIAMVVFGIRIEETTAATEIAEMPDPAEKATAVES